MSRLITQLRDFRRLVAPPSRVETYECLIPTILAIEDKIYIRKIMHVKGM
jgi:hypothetical protein